MILLPELVAVVIALAAAVAMSLPGLQRAAVHRRSLRRACATCRRPIVRGVRTCDCDLSRACATCRQPLVGGAKTCDCDMR